MAVRVIGFCSPDGGEGGEHNGFDLVEMLKIFVMKSTFFLSNCIILQMLQQHIRFLV